MDAVQKSCLAVAERPVLLAEVFYGHLFEMAPWLRPMFAADMTDQMQKMTDTLLAAVAQLSTADTADLEVLLYRMGADHYVRHQVEPAHYVYVAHALTRARRRRLGVQQLPELGVDRPVPVGEHAHVRRRPGRHGRRPRREARVRAAQAPHEPGRGPPRPTVAAAPSDRDVASPRLARHTPFRSRGYEFARPADRPRASDDRGRLPREPGGEQ
jgi:hemoglobin-like flavoprotein